MTATKRRITIELPLPDHALSLNGRGHWRGKHDGQQDQHLMASLVAESRIAPDQRPAFPLPMRLHVDIDVERRRRGKVWDASAIIEACKEAR